MGAGVYWGAMVTKKSGKQVVRQDPAKRSRKRGADSIVARLARIGETVPAEEWDRLPRDSAKNFDHYAHGSPPEA